MEEPERQISMPAPKPVAKLEGNFNITYGPDVVRNNMVFASSLGAVIASMAEAERQLEALLKSLCGGQPRVLAVLLGDFRGHKKLLGSIELALSELGRSEAAATLREIKPKIAEVWVMRDNFAHGVWAKCDQYPDAALWIRSAAIGRAESEARELITAGEFEAAFAKYGDIESAAWTAADFKSAARAADGVVNSITALSVCISQSPEEAAWLHSLLRSQGLLSAPPWKLRSPTQPQETDGTP